MIETSVLMQAGAEIISLRAETEALRKELAETKAALPAALELALELFKERLDLRLNNVLCEMKKGYDDSIVGFNKAWDVMRKLFEETAKARAALNPSPAEKSPT